MSEHRGTRPEMVDPEVVIMGSNPVVETSFLAAEILADLTLVLGLF